MKTKLSVLLVVYLIMMSCSVFCTFVRAGCGLSHNSRPSYQRSPQTNYQQSYHHRPAQPQHYSQPQRYQPQPQHYQPHFQPRPQPHFQPQPQPRPQPQPQPQLQPQPIIPTLTVIPKVPDVKVQETPKK